MVTAPLPLIPGGREGAHGPGREYRLGTKDEGVPGEGTRKPALRAVGRVPLAQTISSCTYDARRSLSARRTRRQGKVSTDMFRGNSLLPVGMCRSRSPGR